MKKTLTVLAVVIIVVFGIYWLTNYGSVNQNGAQSGDADTNMAPSDHAADTNAQSAEEVIGKSVQAKDIVAYHFGTGDTELLFIGGIHGGYSWNTSLVAYELADYLKNNPTVIPANVKVTVIPVLNPDGLSKVTGSSGRFTPSDVSKTDSVVVSGRFNANNVDLNRNFDCDWKSSGVWQTKTVSGGSSAFSEPESAAIKAYVESHKIAGAITWYSSAGGVYASNCHNGVSSQTSALTATYSSASGYPAYNEFNFYEVTGDMVNWFAKENIPAISVLLTNHTDTEWDKNRAGVEAVLKSYAK